MKREGKQRWFMPISSHDGPIFGFGDGKNVKKYETIIYEKRGKQVFVGGSNPTFSHTRNLNLGMEKMGKSMYEKRGKQVFVLTNWWFIIKVFCI